MNPSPQMFILEISHLASLSSHVTLLILPLVFLALSFPPAHSQGHMVTWSREHGQHSPSGPSAPVCPQQRQGAVTPWVPWVRRYRVALASGARLILHTKSRSCNLCASLPYLWSACECLLVSHFVDRPQIPTIPGPHPFLGHKYPPPDDSLDS